MCEKSSCDSTPDVIIAKVTRVDDPVASFDLTGERNTARERERETERAKERKKGAGEGGESLDTVASLKRT